MSERAALTEENVVELGMSLIYTREGFLGSVQLFLCSSGGGKNGQRGMEMESTLMFLDCDA